MRKKLAHLVLLKLRAEQAELHALKESKATVLCRWMRVCIAKLRVQQRRVEYEEELVKSLVMKIWAATSIASGRGKLGRDLARTLKMQTRQRWKALFDETEQRAFYYNQGTGESTWKKPQILLEAEPKPKCSNCNNDRADFECSECAEFLCSACWKWHKNSTIRLQNQFSHKKHCHTTFMWRDNLLGKTRGIVHKIKIDTNITTTNAHIPNLMSIHPMC
eukprot:scaffold27829_cov64-Cyclotella_meneghiniana.AAC.5